MSSEALERHRKENHGTGIGIRVYRQSFSFWRFRTGPENPKPPISAHHHPILVQRLLDDLETSKRGPNKRGV
jgi:hypothetical protein